MPDMAVLVWEYTAAEEYTDSVNEDTGWVNRRRTNSTFVDFARFSLGPAGFGPRGFIAPISNYLHQSAVSGDGIGIPSGVMTFPSEHLAECHDNRNEVGYGHFAVVR